MPVLLEINNISKSYQISSGPFATSSEAILSDISFEIASGEILAVVGESGSGKSTLARQVVKLEQADRGEMLLDGKSCDSVSDLHKRIRMIFQNPLASLNPRKRVYQLLQEPLKNLSDLPISAHRQLIFDCLQRVGLNKEQAQSYPHMLSGGQRQRIAIARAIIVNPQMIVADEALSALDVSIQGQILNLILDLRDELGMAWLFITHDISVVNLIADTVLVLYAGRVMEMGPAKDVLDSPLHPYTRKLLQSVPSIDSNYNYNYNLNPLDAETGGQNKLASASSCVYLARCPISDESCSTTIPLMMSLGKRSVACLKAEGPSIKS